jgi:starch synthase
LSTEKIKMAGDPLASQSSDPAIVFEPDGYQSSGPRVMGRQAAGRGFLRAVVAGRSGPEVWGVTPSRRSAKIFEQTILELDPTARACWCLPGKFDVLTQLGTLYLPEPRIDAASRFRLRAGVAAYSLCGVTHTTASHGAMDTIVGLLTAPVMPWDALICTSQAVAETARRVLDAEIDFLRWRLGAFPQVALPQLPVIPLGVHCADFDFTVDERSASRAALDIDDDEVVALFVGRLTLHGKAHPHAMYAGLQNAVHRTGKRVVLVQCGWSANEAIENAFREGAAQRCPDVRCLFLDGRKRDDLGRGWAAADLFISLADNIQETFGLTPIEAMAARLPVVVTDWDGYKDTVRDGIDGFRIATWMPPANPIGEQIARRYEAGIINYDMYCGLTCQTVSVDGRSLDGRLADLVSNPDLRSRLGESGGQRARQEFDWKMIYKKYQALWAELAKMRRSAQRTSMWQPFLAEAPRASASRMDPFHSFGHYSSSHITPATKVYPTSDSDPQFFRKLCESALYKPLATGQPTQTCVERLLEILKQPSASSDGIDIATLAIRTKMHVEFTVVAISTLAKMHLVRLDRS